MGQVFNSSYTVRPIGTPTLIPTVVDTHYPLFDVSSINVTSTLPNTFHNVSLVPDLFNVTVNTSLLILTNDYITPALNNALSISISSVNVFLSLLNTVCLIYLIKTKSN